MTGAELARVNVILNRLRQRQEAQCVGHVAARLADRGGEISLRCALLLRGGDALRGVVISSDQLIPAALAVFASMKIRIEDE